jgi:hypothetical protein
MVARVPDPSRAGARGVSVMVGRHRHDDDDGDQRSEERQRREDA